jgi:putative PIN family toxin of toxin-antitoxin system
VKLVVDPGVLIAGLAADGLARDIVECRLPACELFTSRALLDKPMEKLRRQFGLEPRELPLLSLYEQAAAVVKTRPLPRRVCPHPDGDEILATALAAGADAILTGDADLLALRQYKGIRILSRRRFVEYLDGSSARR